jgi:hypothetical protein
MVLRRSKFFWLGLFLVPALVIALFWGVAFEGEITGFFRIGELFPKSPFLNVETAWIIPGEVGHDGQQFLSIAFDPALKNPGTIEALDLPAYRYRRIFYPLLGYGLALGQTTWVPYALVLVNYAAIGAIVYWGSAYLLDQGRNPNRALWLLGIPSLWITLSLGTSELVSSALLIGSLYFYRRRNYGFSAIAIAGGCLTRETLLLVWIALCVAGVWERIDRGTFLKLGLAGLPCLLWSLYVEQALGSSLGTATSNNLGLPLLGLVQKIQSFMNVDGLNIKILYDLGCFGLMLLTLALLLIAHGLNWGREKVLGLSSLLIILTFSSLTLTVLGYYSDYVRIFGDLYWLLFLSQPLLENRFPASIVLTRTLFYIALPIASTGLIYEILAS